MSHPWFTHTSDCGCIDCKAYRAWRGPAVIKPPSIIDVGEHKLQAWELRVRPDGANDEAPRARPARTVKPSAVKDRHPFGYKRRRKAKPWHGTAAVELTRPARVTADPDRYVKNLNSYAYDNRWA